MRNNKCMSSVTTENWSEKIYLHPIQKYFARITQGAQILQDKFEEVYSVTLTDFDHREVSQSDFKELSQALTFLNEKYQGKWKLESLSIIDKLQNPSTGSCDTCSAH